MYKVAVLMSTYNGEKYLREQIDSILAQEGVEVTLYVRDDGSSDGTIGIVEEYLRDCKNVILTIGENMGVGNSFMQLVYDTPGDFDYYAFSDQDDIWLKEKIKVAIRKIDQKQGPVLYTSNQMLVDKTGNKLSLRYPENFEMPVSLETEYHNNMISGCTFVFNKRLKLLLAEDIRRPRVELLRKRIHDVWVANVASLYEGIVYDKNAYILYRQHENNVVGGYAHGHLYDIKQKIKKLKNPNLRNGRSLISIELCRTFPEKVVEHPLIYCCKDVFTLKSKLFLITHIKELKKYTSESYIGLIGKIILGFY